MNINNYQSKFVKASLSNLCFIAHDCINQHKKNETVHTINQTKYTNYEFKRNTLEFEALFKLGYIVNNFPDLGSGKLLTKTVFAKHANFPNEFPCWEAGQLDACLAGKKKLHGTLNHNTQLQILHVELTDTALQNIIDCVCSGALDYLRPIYKSILD